MIWHLLWLYPLFGLGLGIYYRVQYRDHTDMDKSDLGPLVPAMTLLWPIGWYFSAKEIRESKQQIDKREEAEYQALLEHVRKQRHAPDPRLAEFDILLGIEPEPKQFSWEDTINDSWEMPEYRVRDIARKTRFSKGGHIKMMSPIEPILNFYDPQPPTTAELRPGIDFNIGLDNTPTTR